MNKHNCKKHSDNYLFMECPNCGIPYCSKCLTQQLAKNFSYQYETKEFNNVSRALQQANQIVPSFHKYLQELTSKIIHLQRELQQKASHNLLQNSLSQTKNKTEFFLWNRAKEIKKTSNKKKRLRSIIGKSREIDSSYLNSLNNLETLFKNCSYLKKDMEKLVRENDYTSIFEIKFSYQPKDLDIVKMMFKKSNAIYKEIQMTKLLKKACKIYKPRKFPCKNLVPIFFKFNELPNDHQELEIPELLNCLSEAKCDFNLFHSVSDNVIQALKKNCSIRSLVIDGFMEEGVNEMIESNHRIQKLTLYNQGIYPLFENNSAIEHLSLQNGRCSLLISMQLSFIGNINLKSLALKKMNLGYEEACYIQNIKIKAEKLKKLSFALKTNSSLLLLDLSKNNIAADGIQYIGSMLEIDTATIQILILNDNEMGWKGFEILAESSYFNRTLRELAIRNNKIKAKASTLEMLSKCISLQILDLSYNKLDHQIDYFIFRNWGLKEIYLNNNSFPAEKIVDIYFALRKNTFIQKFVLTDLPILPKWDPKLNKFEEIQFKKEIEELKNIYNYSVDYSYKKAIISYPIKCILKKNEETKFGEMWNSLKHFISSNKIENIEIGFEMFCKIQEHTITVSEFLRKAVDVKSITLDYNTLKSISYEAIDEELGFKNNHPCFDERIKNLKINYCYNKYADNLHQLLFKKTDLESFAFNYGETERQENLIQNVCTLVHEFKELKTICLVGNKITNEYVITLMNSLNGLTLLENINLKNNLISSGINSIWQFLQQSPQIKKINLAKNKIGNNCKIIANSIPNQIQCINLAKNEIGEKVVCKLLEQFQKWKSLKKFSLKYNELTFDAVLQLKNLITQNKNVVKIDIRSTNYSLPEAILINECLFVGEHLKQLKFYGKPYSNQFIFRQIRNAQRSNKPLFDLNFGNILQNHNSYSLLPKALQNSKNIQNIHFWNFKKHLSFDWLYETIRNTALLQTISLNNMGIVDQQIEALSLALKENSSIKELRLAMNQIGNHGLDSISKMLEFNCILEKLILDRNKIEIISPLINCFRVSKSSLKKLSLRNNLIDSQELLTFLYSLSDASCLEAIDLSHNNANSICILEKPKEFHFGQYLQNLCIESCNISYQQMAVILESLTTTNLHSLLICGNEINENSLELLLNIPNANLKSLSLGNESLTLQIGDSLGRFIFGSKLSKLKLVNFGISAGYYVYKMVNFNENLTNLSLINIHSELETNFLELMLSTSHSLESLKLLGTKKITLLKKDLFYRRKYFNCPSKLCINLPEPTETGDWLMKKFKSFSMKELHIVPDSDVETLIISATYIQNFIQMIRKQTLETLDFSGIFFDQSIVSELWEPLQNSPFLKSLILDNSNFTDENICNLARFLPKFVSLEFLSIRRNKFPFSEETKKILKEYQSQNPFLHLEL